MSRIDPDEYVPKFKVGQEVWHLEGLSRQQRGVIIGRSVERLHGYSPTTFYNISGERGPLRAGEWELTHVSERVTPEVAAQRILDAFAEKLDSYIITVARFTARSWLINIQLAVLNPQRGTKSEVSLRAISTSFEHNKDRLVETIGQWAWTVDGHEGTSENLGAAIVATYNATI